MEGVVNGGVEKGEARPQIEWERSWHAKREENFPIFHKNEKKNFD